MNDKKIQKWAKTRKMGPWRYAFTYGSLWGISVAVLYTFGHSLSHPNEKFNVQEVIIISLMYLIGGILMYRYIVWKNKEEDYHDWLSRRQID